MSNQKKLNGVHILRSNPHFENILVTDSEYNFYYISPLVMTKILSEFDFTINKKKTRNWLDINLDEKRFLDDWVAEM